MFVHVTETLFGSSPAACTLYNTPEKDIQGICLFISLHKIVGESALHVNGRFRLADWRARGRGGESDVVLGWDDSRKTQRERDKQKHR